MAAAWLSLAITLARLGRIEEAEQSRVKARKLGSNVDEVVIADLIPNESENPFENMPHQRAVEFVRAELTKDQLSLESSVAPWDLTSKSEESERRYLSRILEEDSKDSGIQFSANELEQIQAQAVSTILVIVREVPEVPNAAQNDSVHGFTIVKTIENWAPDMAEMQPVVWSMPLAMESAETQAEPVVSSSSPQK
jgi:hypothetical protein